jgi:hypothetical protein
MTRSSSPPRARALAPAVLRTLLFGAAFSASTLVSPSSSAEEAAEAVPEQQELPSRDELNRDPAATGLLLFDLLEEAQAAEKSGDARSALRAYAAIARAVPERATAFSKLCELHRALGERDAAIAACFRATGLPGSKVADQLRYVELLLGKPAGAAFQPREIDELRASFAHLRKEGVSGPELEVLECQFAVVLEELEPLEGCVARLRTTLPRESPVRLTYELSLALFQGDFERGRAIVRAARQSGMNAEAIALMEAELTRRAAPGGAPGSTRESSFGGGLGTALGGGLALTALAVAGWFAHRRRPKTA